MLTTSESKPMTRKMAYKRSGRISSRKAVVAYTTREPSIVRQESLDIDEPIINKAPGTVVLPINVIG